MYLTLSISGFRDSVCKILALSLGNTGYEMSYFKLKQKLKQNLNLSYLVHVYSVLCLYEKKVIYVIIINLHDGNRGNQIILEMLTWVVLENVIYICLMFLFILTNIVSSCAMK